MLSAKIIKFEKYLKCEKNKFLNSFTIFIKIFNLFIFNQIFYFLFFKILFKNIFFVKNALKF